MKSFIFYCFSVPILYGELNSLLDEEFSFCDDSSQWIQRCPQLAEYTNMCRDQINSTATYNGGILQKCKKILELSNFKIWFGTEKVVVTYGGVKNLSLLTTELQELTEDFFLDITLNDCLTSEIPDDAFRTLKIYSLAINCNISEIGRDLFADVPIIARLTFTHSLFTDIPPSIRWATTLKSIRIEESKLRRVNQELQNMTALKRLYFGGNEIETIAEDAFLGLSGLTLLDLSNNRLTVIDRHTFDSLVSIVTLNLNHNNIYSMDGTLTKIFPKLLYLKNNMLSSVADVFSWNMSVVKILHLDNNPLKQLPSGFLSKRNFIDLRQVTLGNTSISYISEDFCKTLSTVRTIDLHDNNISYISPGTFNGCSALDRLKLQNNRLQSLDAVLFKIVGTRFIYLDGNILTTLTGALRKSTEVRELTISNNLLTAIHRENFMNQSWLNRLVLRKNKIIFLDADCFQPLLVLTNLDISDNKIKILNSSVSKLTTLKYLNLSFNELESLTHEDFAGLSGLEYLNVGGNKLNSLGAHFRIPPKLKMLDFSRNNLTAFILDFPESLDLYLQGNPLECGCSLMPLLENLKKSNLKDSPHCKAFGKDEHSLHDLSASSFLALPKFCPPQCKCTCEENKLFINCAQQSLNYNSPVFNKTTIVNQMLTTYSGLIGISLENWNLTSLDGIHFPTDIKMLGLANNHLKRFPVQVINRFHLLEKVTLSGNPWTCDCDAVEFKNWLIEKKSVVVDLNSTTCYEEGKDVDHWKRKIISLTDLELCPQSGLPLTIAGILAGLLAIAAIILSYTKYRLNIKIWLYSHGVTWVKEEDLDHDKVFDAFLSYSSKDESFVVNELVPNLEREGSMYRLCLHYRHFQPGEFIQDNIISAVGSSRRTVMLLSRNYLSSEWCRLEFRAAYMQVLKDKVHRLIIIKYGDLPSLKDMDPVIQTYLESTTYLQWGEKYFWDKLRYSLPKRVPGQVITFNHELVCTIDLSSFPQPTQR